jgi:hypothetical protein
MILIAILCDNVYNDNMLMMRGRIIGGFTLIIIIIIRIISLRLKFKKNGNIEYVNCYFFY